MLPSLQEVCRASIPQSALGVLADVRCLPDVFVTLQGARAWIDWEGGHDEVLARILPVAGLELYAKRGRLWFRPGQSLPTGDLPDTSDRQPLAALIVPTAMAGQPPADQALSPCRVRLVRDPSPRETSAMMCDLGILSGWAESASSQHLASLEAALSGERVLLRGRKLPVLAGSTRLWGQRLLVPLGFHAWPAVAEGALLQALGVADDELLILSAAGGEALPESALQELSRAALRLARKEGR
jgi:hypothetical protein